MPIKPENKARYPRNWKAIRAEILERAGSKCEFCGVANYATRFTDTEYPTADPYSKKATRIVLTIAHLDHTPENCVPENLKALCQKCHLAYDQKHHQASAKETRRKKIAAIQPNLI